MYFSCGLMPVFLRGTRIADFPFEGSLMQHHPASFLTALSACLWHLGSWVGEDRVSKVFPAF